MAKRFTASDKWEDKWFRSLKPTYKLVWVYMLDRCDMAGVIEYDLELAELYIGSKIDEKEFETVFKNRVFKINGSKAWIPKFIEFQYGCTVQELRRDYNLHKGVLKSVDRYKLTEFFTFLNDVSDTPVRGINTPMVEVEVGEEVGVKDKNKEHPIFKDGKLLVPTSLMETFCAEFGRDLVDSQIPAMERWLKFNKPKRDFKRFMFNWLNREGSNGSTQQRNGQNGYRKSGPGGETTADDLRRSSEGSLKLLEEQDRIKGKVG